MLKRRIGFGWTCGAETLTLTKASENKLRVAQRAIERCMFGTSLRNKMTNQCIRQQTKIVMSWKENHLWNWTGEVERITDERWTRGIIY